MFSRWRLPSWLGRPAELWHAAGLSRRLSRLQCVLRSTAGASTGVRCLRSAAAHRVSNAWSIRRPCLRCCRRSCCCSYTSRSKHRSVVALWYEVGSGNGQFLQSVPAVLRHCWLDDGKNIRAVKKPRNSNLTCCKTIWKNRLVKTIR